MGSGLLVDHADQAPELLCFGCAAVGGSGVLWSRTGCRQRHQELPGCLEVALLVRIEPEGPGQTAQGEPGETGPVELLEQSVPLPVRRHPAGIRFEGRFEPAENTINWPSDNRRQIHALPLGGDGTVSRAGARRATVTVSSPGPGSRPRRGARTRSGAGDGGLAVLPVADVALGQ